jgi:hypothetical protein
MADDHSQRPYRSNDTIRRNGQASAPDSSSISDPLTELARLIGQSDPFAEFGRDDAHHPATPQRAAPAPAYAPQTMAPMPEAQPYGAPESEYSQQSSASAPMGTGGEAYPEEDQVPAYLTQHADAASHEQDPYHQNTAAYAAEQEDFYDDYDDVPPPRRRMGILVIAGVFALAVIGTAGAFGYRALFGSSGTSGQPPIIKADSAPSKIVPASAKGAQSNKLITDRISDRSQGEKLVSREEQPIDIKDKPAGVVLPNQQRSFPNQQAGSQSSIAPLGSGIVATEPKKVRTIAIHPDQAIMADAPASAPPVAPMAPMAVKQEAPAPAQPPHVARTKPAAERAPTPRHAAARVAAPVHHAAASAPRNAPLSLSPNAPAQTRHTAPTAHTAHTARPAPTQLASTAANAGTAGGYAVQVSSRRSEADAKAAFRSLQAKYPNQLGGRQPLIHRVNLGAKGVYFRAMVGPFASASEASDLCRRLKSAGGKCIIQRN